MNMLSVSVPVPMFARRMVWRWKYSRGYRHAPPTDVLAGLLASNAKTVLDLGCGRGMMMDALASKGWRGEFHGVELAEAAIDDARHRWPGQRWTVAPMERFVAALPANSRFDAIIIVEALYYLTYLDARKLLDRSIAMLNPGGVLLVRFHDTIKHSEYVAMVAEAGLAARGEVDKIGTAVARVEAI